MSVDGLRRSEKISWATGLVGQNFMFTLQLNFALFAFVEILGLLPAAVGTMLFLARVFDGFNDPIMGVVAERTRTRWGRFRPWLVMVPIPIAIVSAAMFYDPGFSMTGMLIYAYVIYFAWSVFYTLGDIPLWALSSSMTLDAEERTGLVSFGRVGAMFGLMIPAILVPILADVFSPDDQGQGYFLAVALFCAIGAPLMMVAGFGTKERVEVSEDRPSPKEMWEGVKANRPLQLLLASAALGALSFAMQGVLPFFAQYNLGEDNLVGALFGAMIFAAIIGIAVTPALTRRIGKIPSIVWPAYFRAALMVIWWFVGWDSLAVTMVFILLIGISMGPWTVHFTTMIGDSVDVLEADSGTRHEGVAFSLQTFSAKAVGGVAALVTGAVMTWTGYVANQAQTPEALGGIFLMMTLFPAVSTVLSVLPFRWYKITEESHAEAVAALEERNADA